MTKLSSFFLFWMPVFTRSSVTAALMSFDESKAAALLSRTEFTYNIPSLSPSDIKAQISSQSSTQDDDFYYHRRNNPNRSTPAGIEAVRSALTLDWLAAEDSRQRELVAAFETEPGAPVRLQTQDCISFPRPAPGKVARLMLELLKNLEGDEGVLITDLIHALIRSKLLVLETSVFDSEPDLEALVKTPGAMMGEPHVTFPRILGMVWLTVTDPGTVKRHGWCHIIKVSKYLVAAKPSDIARNMRALDPIIARARFLMEEFIQHVTPLNMGKTSPRNLVIYDGKKPKHISPVPGSAGGRNENTSRRTFMNRPFIRRMPSNSSNVDQPVTSAMTTMKPANRRYLDYEHLEELNTSTKSHSKVSCVVMFCIALFRVVF